MKNLDKYVSRVDRILECCRYAPKSAFDIMIELQIPHSSTYSLLRALVKIGWLSSYKDWNKDQSKPTTYFHSVKIIADNPNGKEEIIYKSLDAVRGRT